MSTNPQSPQGSPSEARGSQSPDPFPIHTEDGYCRKATPAGAEGRQSPGLEEARNAVWNLTTAAIIFGKTEDAKVGAEKDAEIDKCQKVILAALAAPVPAGLEEACTLISDWLRLDFDWRRHSDDKAMNQEWVNEISAVHERARALAAPGAPQGGMKDGRFLPDAHPDSLWSQRMREHNRTPSQEEGPAGVDLEADLKAIRSAIANSLKRTEVLIGALRAQAPASSPRAPGAEPPAAPALAMNCMTDNLEAAAIAVRNGQRDRAVEYIESAQGWLRDLREAWPAHPPQGETTSEAAGDLEAAHDFSLRDYVRLVWYASQAAHPPKGETPSEGAELVKAWKDLDAFVHRLHENADYAGWEPWEKSTEKPEYEALRDAVQGLSMRETTLALLSTIKYKSAPGTPIEKGEAALEAIEKAEVELAHMVRAQWEGRPALRLSVPARPGHDSDLILADALAKARASLSSLPQEQTERPKKARECTCVDHCRGGSGLAQGWFCKMAGTRFDLEAPKLAAQEGAAGEGGAG